MMLIETRTRQDIMDLWDRSYIVYRGQGNIIPIPNLTENTWNKESLVEITVAFARGTTYRPGYFDSVTITGTIPGQGSSNEILIEKNITGG
ncbi:MAG TPA: hypothetical protein ENH82_12460 [bacterium]|nr:hypothetical protein [bacterium]